MKKSILYAKHKHKKLIKKNRKKIKPKTQQKEKHQDHPNSNSFFGWFEAAEELSIGLKVQDKPLFLQPNIVTSIMRNINANEATVSDMVSG